MTECVTGGGQDAGTRHDELEEPVGRRWECGSAVGSESDRQPQPPAGTVEGDPEPRASNPSGVAGTGLQKKGSRSSATEKEQPCVYFGRREGCKRGPNCRFVHDNTTTTTDAQKKQLALTETWRRNGPSQDDESPEAVKVLGVPTVPGKSSPCRVGKRGFFFAAARRLRNSWTHREHHGSAAKHQDA